MASEGKEILTRFNPATGEHEKVIRMKRPKTVKEVMALQEKEKARQEAIQTIQQKQKALDKSMEAVHNLNMELAIRMGERLGWSDEKIEAFYKKNSKKRYDELLERAKVLNQMATAYGIPPVEYAMKEEKHEIIYEDMPDIPH